MKATLNKVNLILQKQYPDVEFCRGQGYFYLIGFVNGCDVSSSESSSIMIPYLNQQTLEEWIKDCVDICSKLDK